MATTTALALGLYLATLAPSVTLEQSGALVVAGEHGGVGRPPGYPLWHMIANIFVRVFAFVRYRGHPNPAWATNLMSAVFGALSCGLVSLIVAAAGRQINRSGRGRAPAIVAVATGLLLACSHTLWSQAVITETHTLTLCCIVAFIVVAMHWHVDPCNRWAYRLAIVMGLGFAQSQIVILLVAPLLLCLLLARPRLCREFVLANLFLWVAPVMLWMAAPGGVAPFVAVAFSCMLGVALPWRLSSDGRTALGMCLILVAGASLYAYLPLSAVGTPPMQFGDSRTWPTFMHVITRGQYERLRLAPVGSLTFLMQLRWYAELLGNQFGWLLTLVAVVPLVRCSRFHGPLAKWWATCLLVFIMFSVVLLIGVNPKMDVQDSFFQQVRFIPGFAAWAVNIGFGVLLLLPGPRNPGGPVDRATSS